MGKLIKIWTVTSPPKRCKLNHPLVWEELIRKPKPSATNHRKHLQVTSAKIHDGSVFCVPDSPEFNFYQKQGLLLGEDHHLCFSNLKHQGFRAHTLRCHSQRMQKGSAILWVTEEYSLNNEWLLPVTVFLELQKEMLKVRWLCTEKDYIPIITSKRMGGKACF